MGRKGKRRGSVHYGDECLIDGEMRNRRCVERAHHARQLLARRLSRVTRHYIRPHPSMSEGPKQGHSTRDCASHRTAIARARCVARVHPYHSPGPEYSSFNLSLGSFEHASGEYQAGPPRRVSSPRRTSAGLSIDGGYCSRPR